MKRGRKAACWYAHSGFHGDPHFLFFSISSEEIYVRNRTLTARDRCGCRAQTRRYRRPCRILGLPSQASSRRGRGLGVVFLGAFGGAVVETAIGLDVGNGPARWSAPRSVLPRRFCPNSRPTMRAGSKPAVARPSYHHRAAGRTRSRRRGCEADEENADRQKAAIPRRRAWP